MKIRKGGFTLVEIMIVMAVIGLIAAVAVPNFVRAHTVSVTNACYANAAQLQKAIDMADIDSNGQVPTTNLAESALETVVSPDYLRSMPYCSLGKYSTDESSNVICSVHNATTSGSAAEPTGNPINPVVGPSPLGNPINPGEGPITGIGAYVPTTSTSDGGSTGTSGEGSTDTSTSGEGSTDTGTSGGDFTDTDTSSGGEQSLPPISGTYSTMM